ncbi:hypothetical protein T492DRAFT_988883 [Pavlovales sp. CCMP2436]|nr:hypothetical protein T492DRAFT_988883 [Pavlovales sp. CCMP2436]
MGGTLQQPRLWLAPSLESGTCSGACETFEEGVLASAPEFEVAVVEVWGCGGQDARRAQLDRRGSHADQNRRQQRAFFNGELDPEEKGKGVTNLAKEDKWMFGLMSLGSAKFTGW